MNGNSIEVQNKDPAMPGPAMPVSLE